MQCPVCNTEAKLRKRDFSNVAWASLVAWEEIERSAVGLALCDSCYGDLREILIERSDELQESGQQKGKRSKVA